MNTTQAIRISLELAERVGLSYLNDLSDEELMLRPCPECNHVNWQVGHLVLSENRLMQQIGVRMPPLPEGFAEQYSKQNAANNDAQRFAPKEQLLATYHAQRQATLQALDACSEIDFDQPTGIAYAPTKGALFAMQGSHWLMHCGQWVIVRRLTGKAVVI